MFAGVCTARCTEYLHLFHKLTCKRITTTARQHVVNAPRPERARSRRIATLRWRQCHSRQAHATADSPLRQQHARCALVCNNEKQVKKHKKKGWSALAPRGRARRPPRPSRR
jgi:hypothetical protein